MATRFLKLVLVLFLGVIHVPVTLGQIQRIVACGQINDTDGKPVKNATFYIQFNDDTLFTALSDEEGNYCILADTYGGLKEISLSLEADGYYGLEFTKIDITCSILQDFVMQKIPTNGWSVEYWTWESNCSWPAPHPSSLNTWVSLPGDMFRSPWGTFAYIKANKPALYYPNITQQITVFDVEGQPIPNARVEIKVPNDETRWGLTDANGKLTLYMQFDRGAHFATISIQADGYTAKKHRNQELEMHTQNTYQLSKMD